MISVRKRFKQRINEEEILLVPGCLDVLSARLFKSLGFEAIWAGGFMAAASRLGLADINMITLTEQLEFSRHCVLSTELPVIVDVDNGYGNAINVIRTVREFELAGVAAIVIEDQVIPKHCGLFPGGRPIISVDEMVGKIHAALDTRSDEDFLIVARTDSFGSGLSVDEALERAHAYVEAGADAILPISKVWSNLEEFSKRAEFPVPIIIAPTLFPHITSKLCQDLGFSVQIQPLAATQSALWAMRECLKVWQKDGAPQAYIDRMLTFQDITELIGIPEIAAAELKYLPSGSTLVEV